MNRLVPLVGLVALIIGLALGWMLRDRSRSAAVAESPMGAGTVAPAQASAPTRAANEGIARSVREGELKDLREENERLRTQIKNREWRDRGEEIAPAGMLRLEHISLDGYSGNGASLNPELARFFGLSPEQEAEINAEIKAVHEERQRRLLQNARVESSTAEKVEIKSTAFPEAAIVMQERVKQAVLHAAGDEVGEQLLYFLSGPRAERY